MKFVIALDGSKPSEVAFNYILNLAEKKVDELVLASSFVGKKPLIGKSSTTEESVKELLVGYEQRAAAGWLSAFGKVLHGDPRLALVQFMKESGADMLVMGARGLGPLKRVLLGSVSSYIVSHSHSSVMVVKGNLPVSPRKFLYCYDGSEPSRGALPLLLRLARPGESVFVVHVVQNLTFMRDVPADGEGKPMSPISMSVNEETAAEQATVKEQMDAIVAQLKDLKLNALAILEHGDPREVVHELLTRLSIDMAVAGSSGRSGVHWWSTGSFSADLVQNAQCNAVLVVKPTHAPTRQFSTASETDAT